MPEYQKSRGPRYPFAWLGVPLGLILLFTDRADGVAAARRRRLGCARLQRESGFSPTGRCLFMGIIFLAPVTMAILFGFFGLVTMPIGTTLLGIWFVAAVMLHWSGGCGDGGQIRTDKSHDDA